MLLNGSATWAIFFKGDWRISLVTGRPVFVAFKERFPATLELALSAIALGVPFGLIAGLLTRTRMPVLNKIPGLIGATGLIVPIFWIGLLLMLVGGVWLQWFPMTGRFDYTLSFESKSGFLLIDTLLAGDLQAFGVALNHLALPAICLAFYPAAVVSGVLQARLQEARLEKLVLALKAKGLSPAAIWLRHVLRLLGAPLITAVGTSFGALLGGAILTETVFSWPGMGQYLVGAVLNRDVFIVQYGLLWVVMVIFTVMHLANMLAAMVSPALRESEDA